MARHIYTDGSTPNNQNGAIKGGYGVAVFDTDGVLLETHNCTVHPSDGEAKTTNIRCEMLAFIKALEIARAGDSIYTDNELVSKGYNVWLDGWISRGWRKSDRKPVANEDLWRRVVELRATREGLSVCWVKGHDGNAGNELANELAQAAAA